MSKLNAPILFIPYDRPEIARRVFNKIKEAKPQTLYIYIDGPVISKNNKLEIEKNINLTEEINWECNIFTKIKNENIGAARAVAEAISWIFEKEDRAIIIEEDLLPSNAFFNFCEDLLERYKDDIRILSITGTNLNSNLRLNKNDSYFFSKYATIWGFATWKRVWENYDFEMKKWKLFETQKLIFDDVPIKESKYAFNSYKNFYNKKNFHTWECN